MRPARDSPSDTLRLCSAIRTWCWPTPKCAKCWRVWDDLANVGPGYRCFAFFRRSRLAAESPRARPARNLFSGNAGHVQQSSKSGSVPVVVRGRDGRAIGNLRQENFQLFDKGKLQTITKFTVEKTEVAAPAPAGSASAGGTTATASTPVSSRTVILPERYVAFLFDDVQLPIDDMARARTAAIRMVSESFDPETRAAIYTTSGHVTLDFTSDREKLAQTFRSYPAVSDDYRYSAGLPLPQLLPGLANLGLRGSGGSAVGSNRLPRQMRPSQPTR